MSFLSNLTAKLPFFKKKEIPETYFALCIDTERLTAALWSIEDGKLAILDTADDSYTDEDGIIKITDGLLDAVLGEREIEPQKILFGVPDLWLTDENLKEEYLKLLRKLVKELEVTPMAYVSQTNALVNFLEKQEGIPETAILVGLEEKHLSVTVVRAGKLDGTKIIVQSEDLGIDIEKVLLTYTSVEVLPSKILLYGFGDLDKVKAQLLSFSWMSKLSFLHFPKIEVLPGNIEIAGICFAGASEIDSKVVYHQTEEKKVRKTDTEILVSEKLEEENIVHKKETEKIDVEKTGEKLHEGGKEDLGFIVGDVATQPEKEEEDLQIEDLEQPEDYPLEVGDFEEHASREVLSPNLGFLKKFIPKKSGKLTVIPMIIGGVLLALIAAYLFFLKADVKIFVEPKILENDTQVTADPSIKTVNEADKKIPGQIIEIDISGSGMGTATGKKQVGDSAKGVVTIYNATSQDVLLNKGQILKSDSGIKFTLDKNVKVASKSAGAAAPPTQSEPVGATAADIGADGNIASQSHIQVGNYSKTDVEAVTQGNFSGGNSKNVTVISDSDQQKLLAQVASDLRKTAQQKLQEKLPDKKILEEALSESIAKKSFSKNIGDQATDFKLNLTAHYKGTAFDDKDLRTIVSKLVSTNVPAGFSLDLADTETQADVSKLEKDGRVIFLARFKAKMIPNLNIDDIKHKIKGKTQASAIDIIKNMDNVLGAEIKLTPSIPGPFKLLPFLQRNIQIEVGFK